MHPTIAHQIAVENQRRILDQAAADRLARLATAGRPLPLARLWSMLRRGAPTVDRRPQPRPEARTAGTGRI